MRSGFVCLSVSISLSIYLYPQSLSVSVFVCLSVSLSASLSVSLASLHPSCPPYHPPSLPFQLAPVFPHSCIYPSLLRPEQTHSIDYSGDCLTPWHQMATARHS